MLLDGALRFGRQTQEAWENDSEAANADQFLTRMINIVEELTLGTGTGTEICSKTMSEQYAFVYRELTFSQINRDRDKLYSCLQLLAYQRETWKLACEKLAAELADSSKAPTLTGMHVPMSASGSFSLEV